MISSKQVAEGAKAVKTRELAAADAFLDAHEPAPTMDERIKADGPPWNKPRSVKPKLRW